MRPPRENPFRVDRIGGLAFVGDGVEAIVDRIDAGGRGAIVGPHGAGKSTLLLAVAEGLLARGRRVERVTIPGSATRAERNAAVAAALSAAAVVCVDGYEQLSRAQARRLATVPRLLVTAHAPTPWPTLATLRPTPATLDCVLARLLGDIPPATRAAARAAFARHRGDMRATLLDCYDAWADGAIE